VSRFLNDDILGGANPGAAGFERDPTIRQLLDRAAENLAERFARDPLTEAGLRVALGQAYQTIGERGEAVAHFEAAASRYGAALGAASVPALLARYSMARSLAQTATAEGFTQARSILAEADDLAGTRLDQDGELAFRAAVA